MATIDSDKVGKFIKDNSKGGITVGIAMLFVYTTSLDVKEMDKRLNKMEVNQREIMTTQKQIRSEVSDLWGKYNEAMKGKESLSKEGSKAYFDIMQRINELERKCK